MTVAETIVEQLGGDKIFAMAFAHHSPCSTPMSSIGCSFERGGAIFKIAPALRRNTYVAVSLDASDTYTVKLFTVSGRFYDVKVRDEIGDVYADNLRGVVERMTGLYLSM